jgi:hypothetical protein
MAKDRIPKYLNDINPAPPENLGNKYIFGRDKPVNLYPNKKLLPVFSFLSINLNASPLCFNNPDLSTEDYHKMFERLKTLASVSYEELDKGGKAYRFHSIDFYDKDVALSQEDYINCILDNPDPKKIDYDKIPECYQLEVFEEARITGYLGNSGVFHLLWFDRHHTIYPRK